ncbi:MAG: leucine-rich repeat domain-containing protein [Lachnospiraceae bacterium]|nr:leucine-rich repeat domain-containing protein [Lachnospiraceae bacterium]
MRNLRKLSILLCTAMAVLCAVGISDVKAAKLDGTYNYENTIKGSTNKKKSNFSYRLKKDGTAKISGYSGKDAEVVIPAIIDGIKVTSIARCAFKNNTYIENMTISSGITNIGEEAFFACENLKSVTIPDTVTSIGTGAFASSRKLESVELSKNLTTIASDIFYQCDSLKNIMLPDGIVSINCRAFFSCKSLNSITIPDSVTSLGDEAFANCSSLTEISIGANNPAYISENGVVYNKDKTELLIYPGGKTADFTVPSSVTKIADYAFFCCSNLNNITMHDNVLSIGRDAFYFCENLQDIVLPKNLQSIGVEAFGHCNSFRNVVIPDSVTYMGSHAFARCENLKSVTLSKGVKKIRERTFYSCSSLENVIIPDGVTCIGYFAFASCHNLHAIMISSNVKSIEAYAFSDCILLNDIYYTGSKALWKDIRIGLGRREFEKIPVQCNAEFLINIAEKKYTTYTGKAKKPKVIVLGKDGTIVNPSDYTVKYKDNKNIGIATVTVTGTGMDTHTAHFTIHPKKTNIVKLSAKKNGFWVKWKTQQKQQKQVSGYEIGYSEDKNFYSRFPGVKVKANKDNTTVKGLLGKNYVRVRVYKTIKVGNKKQKIYSEWSPVKMIKTKKSNR